MKIVVAGASGLIGTALVAAWRADGHEVRRLVRRSGAGRVEHDVGDAFSWNPERDEIASDVMPWADVVVNLCGANLGEGLWTAGRRELLARSRLGPTGTLVRAMSEAPEKRRVFLNASAVGFYGSRGDERLTEASRGGTGFLANLCANWEQAALGASDAGARVVCLRFGVVLARGGALAIMLTPFRLGVGARLGSGRQWMSWVALDDAVEMMRRALLDETVSGPVNVVAPAPVTNAEFTATLARVVGRKARLVAPEWALKLLPGGMAEEALLASARAMPEHMTLAGHVFKHSELEGALRAATG